MIFASASVSHFVREDQAFCMPLSIALTKLAPRVLAVDTSLFHVSIIHLIIAFHLSWMNFFPFSMASEMAFAMAFQICVALSLRPFHSPTRKSRALVNHLTMPFTISGMILPPMSCCHSHLKKPTTVSTSHLILSCTQ